MTRVAPAKCLNKSLQNITVATVPIYVLEKEKYWIQSMAKSAPDLDGGGAGAQALWEAPCADTECLVKGWSMKSLVFPRIINIYDATL